MRHKIPLDTIIQVHEASTGFGWDSFVGIIVGWARIPNDEDGSPRYHIIPAKGQTGCPKGLCISANRFTILSSEEAMLFMLER